MNEHQAIKLLRKKYGNIYFVIGGSSTDLYFASLHTWKRHLRILQKNVSLLEPGILYKGEIFDGNTFSLRGSKPCLPQEIEEKIFYADREEYKKEIHMLESNSLGQR